MARHTANTALLSATLNHWLRIDALGVEIRFTKKHSKCSNYQCLWAVSMRVAPPTRISAPIHLDENLGLACCFLVNCGQLPETFMPGTRWRWISACTSCHTCHTCRNPEMCQPSLPRRWLKREAADGPPGRDIPDNLWLASRKNRRFNSKGICKKWEKTQPEGVYGTGGACLPKQQISQINPLEKFPLLNSILGMVTTLSIYLFHIFWRQTKPLCVGKLAWNGKNDETFTLKQKGNNPIVRTSNTSLHAWNQA